MDPSRRDFIKLEYRGRRSIMADEATNPGDRMDERSGRSSSGSGGGSSGTMSGGGTSGNRGDGGVDTRNTGSVSRKTPRGFAAMDPQAQRAIAAKGGRAAHQKGTAHEFTSEEARIAGRKGGEASRGGRRSSASSSNNG
jgi:general stress protein YciG